MKKLIKSFVPILVVSSQAYALVGFGAYGNYDLLKYPSGTDSNTDGTLKIEYDGFNNAGGIGFFCYIDAIPFIDLEASFEIVGNYYKFTPYITSIAQTQGEFPWGRLSTYLTARKEIFGLSIEHLRTGAFPSNGDANLESWNLPEPFSSANKH